MAIYKFLLGLWVILKTFILFVYLLQFKSINSTSLISDDNVEIATQDTEEYIKYRADLVP